MILTQRLTGRPVAQEQRAQEAETVMAVWAAKETSPPEKEIY